MNRLADKIALVSGAGRGTGAATAAKLRKIEVKLSQGKNVLTACCEAGVTDKSYYRWRPIPSRLAALIQLNTGMRISEPVLARLDDLVLNHDIQKGT